MPSAAFLIYSGIMPLIKTFITIIAGYVLAKMEMFPQAASRGASQVSMNVALPALLFANVVPAFTPSNISALGPLFLIAFTYQAIGFLCGLLVREFCYVPRDFWQGIVVLAGMSNWGNLPTAVVLSVTQQAPFNPETDPALGVSYVSIFIVSYHIVFWMLGAAHSLSWDYRPGIPRGEAAEVRVTWKEKPLGSLITRHILHQEAPNSFSAVEASTAKDDIEKYIGEKEEGPSAEDAVQSDLVSDLSSQAVYGANPDPDVQLARRTSRLSTTTAPVQHRRPSLSASAAPSAVPPVPPPTPAQSTRNFDTQSIAQRSETLNIPTLPQKIVRVFRPLGALVTPVTCTLAVSLPIALIQPLKALFVDVSATGGPSFKGPDGRPPLAFMIDTGTPVHIALLCRRASKLILPLLSQLHGRDHRPARAYPARRELRAHQAAPPALTAAHEGHVPHDDGEDGPPPRDRHPARPSDDQGRVRPQGREGPPVRHDVLEWHADCCQPAYRRVAVLARRERRHALGIPSRPIYLHVLLVFSTHGRRASPPVANQPARRPTGWRSFSASVETNAIASHSDSD